MPSRTARLLATLLLVILSVPIRAGASGADTGVWRPPVSGARAISGAWAGVRLFAVGAAFAVGRRSAGYGLQGGAALPLDYGVGLTASYRLTGFSLGDRLGSELADVQQRLGAPFVGIDIEF